MTGPPRKNINTRVPEEVLAAADHVLEQKGLKREALIVAFLAALPEHRDLLVRLLEPYQPPERPVGRPRRID